MTKDQVSILCIDDSRDHRFILERILTSAGFTVSTAASGEEGLEKARSAAPDLIFLDLMMPGMDGFETCARLLKERGMLNVPVVFLTSSRSEEDRRRAFMAGAADFLSKPVKKTEVLEKVQQHLMGRTRWIELESPRRKSHARTLPMFQQFLSFAAGETGLTAGKKEEIERSTPSRFFADFSSIGVPGTRVSALLGAFLGHEVFPDLSGVEPRLGVLPTAFCKANLVLPVTVDGAEGFVIANPFAREIMDIIGNRDDPEPFWLCDPGVIRLFFANLLGEAGAAKPEAAPKVDLDRILADLEGDTLPLRAAEEDAEVSEDDSHVVKLVHGILTDGWNRRASDIHIEPLNESGVRVRYRIDGVMVSAHTLAWPLRHVVPSRLKIMAGLDIAEKRRPQSGKIAFRRWGGPDIELRVETYPTVSGAEDVVLRILSSSKPLPLKQLGMSPANLEAFTGMIERPHGIVLCVGPTGSGKTTTLHSALAHLNRDDAKILTAEDPVEITQPGLRQIQVNPKAGFTFAAAMRSFLRADPDVIMIGEMRDLETCSTAIEASLTGHLVMSTLHTNSAPETVGRLLNVGVDNFSLGDSLLGVLAQRLVRKLCGACRVEGAMSAQERERLAIMYGDEGAFEEMAAAARGRIWRPRECGCPECDGLGLRGRAAVHELLVADEGVRDLIYRNAPASAVHAHAISRGMKTLRQDGVRKVLAGATTLSELQSVCGH